MEGTLQSLFPERHRRLLVLLQDRLVPATNKQEPDMNTLSGKTALVTGASRGMGRAAALELGKAGAQVLVHYSNGAKEAEAVVAEIRATGARADAVQADLSQADGAHKLAKQVRPIVG